MFKLKRIINSGTSAPEPIRLPKKTNTTFHPGELLRLGVNGLTACAYIDYPDFISLGTYSGDEAVCFAVTEDMLFECECHDKTNTPRIGEQYDIYCDDYTALELGNLNSEGAATILGVNGNTITVKFKRIYMV